MTVPVGVIRVATGLFNLNIPEADIFEAWIAMVIICVMVFKICRDWWCAKTLLSPRKVQETAQG